MIKRMIVIFTLFVLVTLIWSCSLLGADNNIYIYQYGSRIGMYTKEEFVNLLKGYNQYKDIMEAQSDNRVVVSLIETPYKTGSTKNEYTAKFRVVWENKEKTGINYLIIESIVTIPEETGGVFLPAWRVVYRDISEIGFPVSSVLMIICMIILAL